MLFNITNMSAGVCVRLKNIWCMYFAICRSEDNKMWRNDFSHDYIYAIVYLKAVGSETNFYLLRKWNVCDRYFRNDRPHNLIKNLKLDQ